MRCIAYLNAGKLDLQNRNLNDVTNSYPELKSIADNVKSKSVILDGEIVVLDKGLPSFDLLQNRFGVNEPIQVRRLASKIPTTYIAFDLLHVNGTDLISRPLEERREKLTGIVTDSPHLLLSQTVRGSGRAYFRNALKLGFEGAVAKEAESAYQIGVRSENWLKLKQVKTMDCVIAGYTAGTGSRGSTFGALVLAAYGKRGDLKHLGNVGTGFNDATLTRMMTLLKPLQTKSKTVPGEVKALAPIEWVKPQLVAEVGYMNMTREGKMRLPRFLRLRFDKAPSECLL
jgi:bifunctional non-homologous end joining protein LigD